MNATDSASVSRCARDTSRRSLVPAADVAELVDQDVHPLGQRIGRVHVDDLARCSWCDRGCPRLRLGGQTSSRAVDQRGEGVPSRLRGVAGDVADLGGLGQRFALGVLVAEHPLQPEPAHHQRRAPVGVVTPAAARPWRARRPPPAVSRRRTGASTANERAPLTT